MAEKEPRKISDLIRERFAEPSDIGKDRLSSGTHATQLAHRSHRRFKNTPVAEETLQLLYACALSAPSKSDLQQTAIIHLDEPVARDFIQRSIPAMPWISSAPVFLLFCGDSRRIRDVCEFHNTGFAHDPLDALVNAVADSAIVLQNFIIAAEAEGLGCCPISAVREITESLADFCALPDGVFPLAGLCLGYAEDDPAISVRLPARVIVHKNRYDASSLADEIAKYDRRRQQKNPYRNQRQADKYGLSEDYGWSCDKARQTSTTDRISFSNHVRKHGFKL